MCVLFFVLVQKCGLHAAWIKCIVKIIKRTIKMALRRH